MAEFRQFETGATRDTDNGKLDYEGFLSPLVLKRFDRYLDEQRALAWAAGLFEGEGCITTTRAGGRHYPRLTMSLTDEDTIRRFAAILGGTVRGPYCKPRRKPIWFWQLGRKEDCRTAAGRLFPYLGSRRSARLVSVFGAPVAAEMAGISPRAVEAFGRYMHKNRVQKDGSLRDSDNWQKGIPLDAYMKSGWRHFVDWWRLHREGSDPKREPARSIAGEIRPELEEALCALLFNMQGYLHEILRGKTTSPSLAEQKRRDRATATEVEAAFRSPDLHHCEGCGPVRPGGEAAAVCPHKPFSQGCVYEVKGGA